MKKLLLSVVTLGLSMNLAGCNPSNSTGKKSTASSSVEQTAEDISAKKDEKMTQMEEKLQEKGVEINQYDDLLYFEREKGIDYDYFEMTIIFVEEEVDEIYQVRLTLKGNIDGKDKDDLIYKVNKGRLVESSGDNTDIDALADVLKSLDYSDKDMVDFAEWYYQKNK